MKKLNFIYLVTLAVFTLGVSACETIHGAGRDIEKGGEAIQDAAE